MQEVAGSDYVSLWRSVRRRGGVVNVTREEIMQLTGRELDAAVAERVMGWKRGDPKYGDMPWYPPGTGRYLGGGRMDLPEFSADIAAAWEVVEHLATPDEALMITYSKGTWVVAVGSVEASATSESAPEAICRAALLAALKRHEAMNGGGEA